MIITLFVWLFALFLMAGGITHFIYPAVFDGFMPSFTPKIPAHILAGVAEITIAVALVLPKFRAFGGLFAAMLCTAYLPFHIWDLFRPDPVVAPFWAAIARLFVQFAMIGFGIHLWRTEPKVRSN
ncbi:MULTISPECIES: hypothetical protein [unclassified Ruegeria]|uniref:hypothetical protein n=1 Tax=unclassified Ruegeria TaxID=2625375 RepID=UPI0014895800|nr:MULTISPECIES: hypothetical protein [unclassified Ruegeria]NOD77689.1 hypothetical protein [Ruegeria sp. HKCCD4332]NOD89897.1 hypothetical protein [Ruegeria sp. HKCCD4318]NOE14657.1 hypothetical protein [Ruegeria sp. HKCCD4318-2]NOG10989.1 hypothetical protein [Ruegeria sp. HKCCD4315]